MYKTITCNIMVENVANTVQFYEEKLGFKKVLSVPEESENIEFAIMNKDSISLMFEEKNSLESEYPTLKTDRIKPTFTLFITVEDVKKVYEKLKDKVEIAKELHQTFYGKDEFAIYDNNGNILTISC